MQADLGKEVVVVVRCSKGDPKVQQAASACVQCAVCALWGQTAGGRGLGWGRVEKGKGIKSKAESA